MTNANTSHKSITDDVLHDCIMANSQHIARERSRTNLQAKDAQYCKRILPQVGNVRTHAHKHVRGVHVHDALT